MKKINILKIIFIGALLLILLFIIVPLTRIIIAIDPSILMDVIRKTELVSSFLLTFKTACVATIIASVVGIPAAYILVRTNFPGHSLVEAFIDLPVMVPHTAAGIALLSVFGSNTLLGKTISLFGLKIPGTEAGIVIGMIFVSMSYLVNHAKNGFYKVDPKLEIASRSLGAGEMRTFFLISLPLAKRDIINGLLMMWARGISEYGAVVILTYNPKSASIFILDLFQGYGLTWSRPAAGLLIVVCLLVFTVIRFLNAKKDER